MKAVILAGGKGERMRPLTLKTPKSLLKVNGKPIIDYVLKSLGSEVDEVVVVIRYKGIQIKKYLGNKRYGKKIFYVRDKGIGTAYAILATKKVIKNERFVIVFGDEIPNTSDVARCIKKGLAISTFKSNNPSLHGIIYLCEDGSIKRIIEKPSRSKSDLAIAGVIVVNSDIFNYKPKASRRNEYYLTSLINDFAKAHKVYTVMAKNFIGDFTCPEDLERVGTKLKNYAK